MMTTNGKEVCVVLIYTGYTDGSVSFTQDATRKDFGIVKQCMFNALRHMAQTIHRAKECPFNPDNKMKYGMEDKDNTHFS